METIIAALVSAAAAIVVCLITSKAQNSKVVALLEFKLEDLIKKVEKHNNLVERTYDIENRLTRLDEKMSVANHRIDDLERSQP